MRKDLFDVIVLDGHVLLGLSESRIYIEDGILKCIEISVSLEDDLLPVPLIYEYGMDIIGFFIRSDGVHIGVETFVNFEAVLCKCISLPLRKRLYNLCLSAAFVADGKFNGMLDTVKVII